LSNLCLRLYNGDMENEEVNPDMAKRTIIKFPNPILRTRCEKVEEITDEIIQLLDDMIETMYAANGVGLAAPQVGVLKRLFVADVGDGVFEFINPEIIQVNGTELGPDGCLSIPGISGETYRSYTLTIRAQNRQGEWFELQANGFFARCIQHECDHLDGVLFIDKALRLYEDRDDTDNKETKTTQQVTNQSLVQQIMQHAKDDVTDDIRRLILADYRRQAQALRALLDEHRDRPIIRFANEWEIERPDLEEDWIHLSRIGSLSQRKPKQ
jgi:peptide deformylase